MTAFCEPDDVQRALQVATAKFETNELSSVNVRTAIEGVSDWLDTKSQRFWYDSTATDADLVSNTPATASNLLLDVPSSPHRQGNQVFRESRGTTRYPNTHAGRYVRVRLPRYAVQSIDTLEVRERDGDVTDWVAAAGKVEGRGEDYYVQTDTTDGHPVAYLYLDAGSIGPRVDFEDLLTVEATYGTDYDSEPWDGIRRGVAALAGAQLVVDDDVLAGLPDGAQLVGVDTEVQQLINMAFGDYGTLDSVMEVRVA